MLKGLLMRRQSSQVSSSATPPSLENDPEAVLAAAVPGSDKTTRSRNHVVQGYMGNSDHPAVMW